MQLFLIGAGHVGLVTAAGLVRLGHRVTVADIDAARIERLRAGTPPVFEPGLTDALAAAAASGAIAYTTELDPPVGAAFTFVCVSTPTGPDGPLDTRNVESAVTRLLDRATPDHAIVVRSTLPLDGPARLRALVAERGAPGIDRPSLVTNPEFMREGQALADFDRPSRVVAGFVTPADRPAAEAVIAIHASLGGPTLIADAGSVALIKLMSNVFLGMKVAYANELARVADALGADVATVIEGVGLDPRIGTAFMKPGPGFGGSCLPEQSVAIALQTEAIGVDAPLLSAIHRSNGTHQGAIVSRLASLLGGAGSLDGKRVVLLGLAFKANTDDVRESPALALAVQLRAAGATVVAYDPMAAPKALAADPGLDTAPSAGEAAAGADAILVATEWPEFGALDWPALAAGMPGRVVYDTRDVVDVEGATAAGFRVERLGSRGAAS